MLATNGTPTRAAPRAIASSPSGCASVCTPIGASSTGAPSSVPSTVRREASLGDVAQHSRSQAPVVKRLAIGAHRLAQPRAARDVSPWPAPQQVHRVLLQLAPVQRPCGALPRHAAQVDLVLVVGVWDRVAHLLGGTLSASLEARRSSLSGLAAADSLGAVRGRISIGRLMLLILLVLAAAVIVLNWTYGRLPAEPKPTGSSYRSTGCGFTTSNVLGRACPSC